MDEVAEGEEVKEREAEAEPLGARVQRRGRWTEGYANQAVGPNYLLLEIPEVALELAHKDSHSTAAA